jgi:hypothetical protein
LAFLLQIERNRRLEVRKTESQAERRRKQRPQSEGREGWPRPVQENDLRQVAEAAKSNDPDAIYKLHPLQHVKTQGEEGGGWKGPPDFLRAHSRLERRLAPRRRRSPTHFLQASSLWRSATPNRRT